MYNKNMKDKDFKSLLNEKLGKTLNTFNCDYEFFNEKTTLLYEHENSSRGMLHNLVKVMIIAKLRKNEQFTLFLIPTSHHSTKHTCDRIRSEFIINSEGMPKNLKCEIITESTFVNNIEKYTTNL